MVRVLCNDCFALTAGSITTDVCTLQVLRGTTCQTAPVETNWQIQNTVRLDTIEKTARFAQNSAGIANDGVARSACILRRSHRLNPGKAPPASVCEVSDRVVYMHPS